MPGLRPLTSTATAVCALALLTPSPASADPLPPPPGPASLPALTVPGKPTLKSTDSRGTSVGTSADQDQTIVGLPGSRIGNSPYRISQTGPTSGVRTTTGTGGVGVDATNLVGGQEDPHGNPPPAPAPGNEGGFVPTPPIPEPGDFAAPPAWMESYCVLCRETGDRHSFSEISQSRSARRGSLA